MARASVPDASWTPSWGGFPGASCQGRDPGEDSGHAGGIMSPDWPGNASVSSRRSRRKCLGRGKSGHLCLDCCPPPDKRKKMDGWNPFTSTISHCWIFLTFPEQQSPLRYSRKKKCYPVDVLTILLKIIIMILKMPMLSLFVTSLG